MRTPTPGVKLILSGAALLTAWWVFERLDSGHEMHRQLWALGQSNYHEVRAKLAASPAPAVGVGSIFGRWQDERPAVTGNIERAQDHVTLSLVGSGTIYYTIDGSMPTHRSRRYAEPLRIDSSMVVRARALRPGSIPGMTATWHFPIIAEPRLPVISIATDPTGLWNRYSGIYANPLKRGREWERGATIAYVPANGSDMVVLDAEIRIHGGYSRLVPKKSFRVRIDDPAGSRLRSFSLLHDSLAHGSRTLVLRTDAGAPVRNIREALASTLYEELGGFVSRREPVELLLNGTYWGLYDLRERVDSAFLQSRLGDGSWELLTHDSERATQWLSAVVGDMDAWNETLEVLRETDLATAHGIAAAAELIDLDRMIDYWLHNIYVANLDWPYNNVHVFRNAEGGDRRWKWISWDLDPAYARVDHNTLAWALRDRVRNDLKWNFAAGRYEDDEGFLVSTEPIRLLLRNPDFRDRFIARAQVLLDLHYTEKHTETVLASIINDTEPARARDAHRWQWTDSAYHAGIATLRQFVRERPDRMRQHLADHFGLGPPAQVRISWTGGGTVYVEGVQLPEPGVVLNARRGTKLRVSTHAGATFPEGLPRDTTVRVTGDTTVYLRPLP